MTDRQTYASSSALVLVPQSAKPERALDPLSLGSSNALPPSGQIIA